LAQQYPAIEVKDDSGTAKYSLLISGDLANAKKLVVRPMSWSDHPGRGFEALREALIADPSEDWRLLASVFLRGL